MIKKTLYFGNPAYLSLKDLQMLIRLPEVERSASVNIEFKKQAELTIPIEDIGIVIIDNKQITITHGLMEILVENSSKEGEVVLDPFMGIGTTGIARPMSSKAYTDSLRVI